MKRLLLPLAALCLLLAAAACSRDSTTPTTQPQAVSFFDFFQDEEISAFADTFNTNRPVSVSYTFHGEASGEPVTSTDPQDILAVYQALQGITVAEQAGMMAADSTHIFEFTLQDGSCVSFVFNTHNLEYGGAVYTIENDGALWSLIPDIFA